MSNAELARARERAERDSYSRYADDHPETLAQDDRETLAWIEECQRADDARLRRLRAEQAGRGKAKPATN